MSRFAIQEVLSAEDIITANAGEICVVCKAAKHPLYLCSKFRDLPHKDMLTTLKENWLYMNCLGSGHFAKGCKSTARSVNCANRSDRDKGIRFYRLPSVITHQGVQTKERSQERQLAWLAKIRREDLLPGQYKNVRVCSTHFLSGAPSTLYDVTNPDWAPSLNLGYDPVGDYTV